MMDRNTKRFTVIRVPSRPPPVELAVITGLWVDNNHVGFFSDFVEVDMFEKVVTSCKSNNNNKTLSYDGSNGSQKELLHTRFIKFVHIDIFHTYK